MLWKTRGKHAGAHSRGACVGGEGNKVKIFMPIASGDKEIKVTLRSHPCGARWVSARSDNRRYLMETGFDGIEAKGEMRWLRVKV